MTIPIAEKLRPKRLDEFVGQTHLLGDGRPLRMMLEHKQLHSMIFWGPPGTGKTTLAEIVANYFDCDFYPASAITSGVKEIKQIAEKAKQSLRPTLLFIDEIHRFSKSQQDVLLPFIERGVLTFVGATTENPAFSLNNALLSRLTLYPFHALKPEELDAMLSRAIPMEVSFEEGTREQLLQLADGDGRRLLNIFEGILRLVEKRGGIVTQMILSEVAKNQTRYFDNKGDLFYELISALHKSVRGSSPDGALYWCVRLLEAGCDPRYVARRLIRIASEDIGCADLNALNISLNALKAYEVLGTPEGELAIEEAAVYLALAPKSNALYMADSAVREAIQKTGTAPVPMHLRNAPSQLQKSMGYGKRYRYAHDFPNAYVPGEQYLPDVLQTRRFYEPTNRGLEAKLQEKQKRLRELDEAASRSREEA